MFLLMIAIGWYVFVEDLLGKERAHGQISFVVAHRLSWYFCIAIICKHLLLFSKWLLFWIDFKQRKCGDRQYSSKILKGSVLASRGEYIHYNICMLSSTCPFEESDIILMITSIYKIRFQIIRIVCSEWLQMIERNIGDIFIQKESIQQCEDES